jgi:hypothetical protein
MSLVNRPPKIQDEFTDLPISKTQKQYLRHKRDGLCVKCNQPRCEASNTLCLRHWRPLAEESERKRLAREQRAQERIQENREVPFIFSDAELARRQSLTIPLPRLGNYKYYKPKK